MTVWTAAFLAEDAAESACRSAAAALGAPFRARALNRAAEHAAARTRIQTLLTDTPPLPPAYAWGDALASPRDATDLIITTENALVPVYADAAAGDSGPSRGWAVDQAMACAVTAVRWGGASQAFPQGPSSAEGGHDIPAEPNDQ